nr:meiotically up-regulated gene 60 protein [Quercus suber]
MHKISNFTGHAARHGWDKMTPSMGFGMSRAQPQDLSIAPLPGKRSLAGSSMSPNPAVPGTMVNLSFNVPFNSNLPGPPDKEDVLYSSPGSYDHWIHPEGAPDDVPNHALPVHTRNVENLRSLCKQMSAGMDRIHATVTSSKPKPVPGMQRGPLTALVTNVCISGDAEVRCETIDIDREIVFPNDQDSARVDIIHHMDDIAHKTKADIFMLEAKSRRKDSDTPGSLEKSMDKRLQIQVYGDMESAENAKTRILIMIDQILQRQVDTMGLELSLHTLISGRNRRNIKMIESATGTAIYFPPLFPTVFGYTTPGSMPLRARDEVIITGESMDNIMQAKKRLHDLVMTTKTFVKEVHVTTSKVDYILLERLDKIRKIIEANGSYVLLPSLGKYSGTLRVQATDILNVERTVREIMGLAGQFYSATWWVNHTDASQRQPTPSDIRAMLPDICINSGAEITFEKLNFHINGSDDAVKAAMAIINTLPFVKKAQSTLRVKVELANEHKEFVSGKKNGKINKIMSQSNVQIVFDGFNEYNFYIDVRGAQYEATKNGLDLVELEMPAAISFHVPDQYHKRIIGIGGQHIQRIMKKYSVFVKFSNAMDRGGIGKDDDDVKVDNVICRTPARNADNLELVKQEIMDMVEKVDAEFVSEQIPVDRLYHRELITRMSEIEELEKKWNCKITFPSTEQASDIITVSGPEYQVPQAVDEFLGMVPETHEIEFPSSDELRKFLTSDEFRQDYSQKLQDQYVVEVAVSEPHPEKHGDQELIVEKLILSYTRNNAGGLKDAIDFLLLPFIARGLEADRVKGAIPRPKSDSFEDNMLFFESKLLQRAEPPVTRESPTHATFGEDGGSRSIFDKLRKPGSMSSFSSFIDRRRKNGTNSPGSLFMHASSNASKASLVSMESRDSGYRNPWNDSGIDLDHDTNALHSHTPSGSNHGNGWGSFGASVSRPNTSSTSLSGAFETKFPFGANNNASTTSLNTPMIPGLGMVNQNGGSNVLVKSPFTSAPGDTTPKSDAQGRALDGMMTSAALPTARPVTATSNPIISTNLSAAGASASNSPRYPAPIGPPR